MTAETKKRWGELGFKVLEIVLDKGLLAGALILVALFANGLLEAFKGAITAKLDDHRAKLKDDGDRYLASFKTELDRGMEDYRHRLAMQHYVAQKRFEAIDGVIIAHNKLFALYVDHTRAGESTKAMRDNYRKAIIAVFEAHGNKELVMARHFSTQLEKLAFAHRGLLVNGFDEKYMDFLVDMGDQLSQMGRDAIDPPAEKAPAYFELAKLPPPAERKDNKVAARYLDSELNRWAVWHKANPHRAAAPAARPELVGCGKSTGEYHLREGL